MFSSLRKLQAAGGVQIGLGQSKEQLKLQIGSDFDRKGDTPKNQRWRILLLKDNVRKQNTHSCSFSAHLLNRNSAIGLMLSSRSMSRKMG